jgi:hypothetical protein
MLRTVGLVAPSIRNHISLAVFSVVVTAVALAMPFPARAGTVTFVDLTDTITLSDGTGRTSGFSCTGESCVVTITGPMGTNAELGQFITLEWEEPGTNILSDEFCIGLFGCSFVHGDNHFQFR